MLREAGIPFAQNDQNTKKRNTSTKFTQLGENRLRLKFDANTRAVAEGKNHSERSDKEFDVLKMRSLRDKAFSVDLKEEILFAFDDLNEKATDPESIELTSSVSEVDLFNAEQDKRTAELIALDMEIDSVLTSPLLDSTPQEVL